MIKNISWLSAVRGAILRIVPLSVIALRYGRDASYTRYDTRYLRVAPNVGSSRCGASSTQSRLIRSPAGTHSDRMNGRLTRLYHVL
jgi:hypothetical protein